MVNLLQIRTGDEQSDQYVLVSQQEIPRGITVKADPDGLCHAEGDQLEVSKLIQGRAVFTAKKVQETTRIERGV